VRKSLAQEAPRGFDPAVLAAVEPARLGLAEEDGVDQVVTIVGAGLAIGFVAAGTTAWLRRSRRQRLRRAVREFRMYRELLEAKFFDLASRSGKPRGLRWVDCDWKDVVTFGRDVRTGLTTAFVSVEIQFEAEEGGDMEDVAAVGTIRDACALFHYADGRWGTGGRALFNMDAQEALSRLEGQYEPLPVET
jgi:hypothetical protein